MVTAGGADELERIEVAAFHPAIHNADRLAPEACCPAMAGLASKWRGHSDIGIGVQPRITGAAMATGGRGGSRTGSLLNNTGRDVHL